MFAASAVVAGLLLGAAPAQAASTVIAAPNAMVGMPTNVWVNAPDAANTTVPVTFTQGTLTATATAGLNARGIGRASWTPTNGGVWTVTAAGGSGSAVVSAMPTETTVATLTAIAVNAPTTIVATVQAAAGSITPTGTVFVSNAYNGQQIGFADLTPTATPGRAIANIAWTPPTTGTIPVVARFMPGPTSGMAASLSPAWSTNVVYTQPALTLLVPSPLTVGTPVTITGHVNVPITTGTMAFTLSQTGIAPGNVVGLTGSLPITGGATTFTWTPTMQGNAIINATFSGTYGQNWPTSGTAQLWVYVEPDPPADPISVVTSASGPLVAGQPAALRNGAPVALLPSTGSGAPVALSSAGSCAIAGNVLFATANAGSCTVTAFSPGSAAFDSNTATYTFTLQPKAKAPSKRR